MPPARASRTPLVSVILPTFNRATFLPDAFASIGRQQWDHLEVVVVDDGSTDDTPRVVDEARRLLNVPVRYQFQANRGAYGARNTGLDLAGGEYVAFFDSDDIWRDGYLQRMVGTLEGEPEIDWLYAACEMVDAETGTVVQASTFRPDGRARPFLHLPRTPAGDAWRVAAADALVCQLSTGLFSGLQNSVIRRRVFEPARFWDDYRVVEDVLFLVRALATGLSMGYLDEVLVEYRVHDDNSSAAATGADAGRLLPIFEEEVRGFERIRKEVVLSTDATAALDRWLANTYFWRLGYAGYWQLGRTVEAMQAFRRGLQLRPLDWRMWKTYVSCNLKRALP